MADRQCADDDRHGGPKASPRPGSVPTDADLLESFVSRRDEQAFAALMERHGPMVLRLCHQLLSDAHEAEDAFQATFLVLVRRAGSIRERELLGNWLYGVAHRVAARARAQRTRRRTREGRAVDVRRRFGVALDKHVDAGGDRGLGRGALATRQQEGDEQDGQGHVFSDYLNSSRRVRV